MKKTLQLCIVGAISFYLAAQAQGPRAEHGGFEGRLGMMSMGPGSRTPVTGAPYSAVQTTVTQQTLADGNQVTRQEQTKVFRDSQGRVRIEHTGGRGEPVTAIFDPVAGFSHILRSSTMSAISTPMRRRPSTEGFAPRHAQRQGQAQTEDLGTQVINGLSATGTRTTRTIPAGEIGNQQPIRIVREAWVSTDLKVPVLIKTSDPRFGTTTMQLTDIVRAEPDASLFQVPAGYKMTTRPSRGPHPADQ
jgi:hypothetical protein